MTDNRRAHIALLGIAAFLFAIAGGGMTLVSLRLEELACPAWVGWECSRLSELPSISWIVTWSLIGLGLLSSAGSVYLWGKVFLSKKAQRTAP